MLINNIIIIDNILIRFKLILSNDNNKMLSRRNSISTNNGIIAETYNLPDDSNSNDYKIG